MGDPFPITPAKVPAVNTKHRRINTAIPHPDSVKILEKLRQVEPICMEGQPAIVWHKADSYYVQDAYGNQWIDMTSGVLITNAGHGRKEMTDAVTQVAQQGLLTTYCFPHQYRADLVEALRQVAPRPTDKVMLLSTGSEATELCLKLAREHGRRVGKKDGVFVTFNNAFHGRTMGSQLAGGIPSLKEWIGYGDSHFANIPFPDGGVRSPKEADDFSYFEATLAKHGIKPEQVVGVMTETYQGGNSSFAPPAYIQALRKWCDKHQAILIMDEVQAGFGRTGKFWGFEHYGIQPDLIACGKGISGSMPLSAVIGKAELLDQFPPGSMTSTHSGNPVCCAAALASLNIIHKEKLVENSAKTGELIQAAARRIQKRFGDVILVAHGKGMVASLHVVKPGTTEPDGKLAWQVILKAVQAGVMLFGGVGFGGASVKVCPPLTMPADVVEEAMNVLEESFAAVLEEASVTR